MDAPTTSYPTLGGYEILSELRRDRLGVVYRARQLLYNRDVALRLIDERARGGSRDLTEPCHAADIAVRLSHPLLVPLLDAGENEGQFYLAEEMPPGPSLRQHLAGRGPMPPADAAALVGSVARTVQHLHEHHALHLGLTPTSIFLANDGSPRVADIGLSGLLQHHPGASFPGDPAYAAPEQLAGKRAETRADVYALGCLLHECLTGQPPVDASGRPHLALAACPPALAAICRKALAARPEQRYASASELADDLDRFQHGEAQVPGRLARLVDWAQRTPATAGLLVVLVLVLVGAVCQAAFLSSRLASARAEAAQWQDEARQASDDTKKARNDGDRAAHRDAELLRSARNSAHLAHLERDRQRKRASKEAARRLAAEQAAKAESERRKSAEERAREAEEERKSAVAARAGAARQLAGLHVGHGTALLETGDLSGALIPFVRALAVAHREKLPEDAHRLRIAALLSRCPRPLCALGYPKGDVSSVVLSPNGERLATVGADGVVKVRSALTGSLVGKQLVHGAVAAAAVFSPDSKRLLTADGKGVVWLWNVEDGKEVFEPVQLEAVPSHLGFSGDGKRFVTVTATKGDEPGAEVVVRDVSDGDTIGQAITTQIAPRPAVLSRDGKQVLVCCTDRAARVHDVQTGKQVGAALGHDGEVVAATFSPDGRLILTAGDGKARVWSVATGKLVAALEHDHPSIAAMFDETGRLVLTAAKDGSVRIHDTTTGKRIGPALRTRATLRQAVLAPDGRYVLLAGANGTAQLVDAVTGALALPPLVHGQLVRYMAFSPDGTRALTFDGRALRVWDLSAGEPLVPAGLPVESGVTYSTDGKRMARISGDTVQLHDPASGKPVGAAMKHKGDVQRVAFSPKGDLVLTVSNPPEGKEGTPTWDVRVWDAGTGKPASEVMEHLREVRQARFAADGTRVLTVALDKKVRLWEAKTGKLACKEIDHDADVVLAELSPDGRRVITSDENGITRAWDATKGELVGRAMAHSKPVRFMAFDGASKHLATCSEDGTARVWELATGRKVLEAEHAGPVTHASFSSDGKLLLTGSADGTARAWNVETGKAHTPPLSHTEPVQLTAFSETGRWLLTAAGRLVRLWDGQTGEAIGPPLRHSSTSAAITRMSFSKGGQLLTESGPGSRWSRRLVPDTRPEADLMALARAISGRDEAGAGQLVALAANDLESAHDQATKRHRSEFQQGHSRLLAWARRGAAECEARGLWGGAIHHLNALVEQSPNDISLYARRGKARLEMGQYDLALADYGKALEKDGSRWQWWAGRGDAAAALKRWPEAAADYERATKLEDRRADLWRRLGRAEAEREQWKQSAQALAQAIRFGGDDAAVWLEHALAQLSNGDVKGYRATCGRLVKKFGRRQDAASRRVVLTACALGPDAVTDFKALLEQAEKAVRAAPDEVGEQVRLAALLLRAGQAARAVTLLEKVAAEPARSDYRWLLVLAYHRAGQKDRAKELLAKALEAKERPDAGWQERQTGVLWRKEAEASVPGG
jgi:WD40 repeat protein/tetratricopeptide (TPR) repeat protein